MIKSDSKTKPLSVSIIKPELEDNCSDLCLKPPTDNIIKKECYTLPKIKYTREEPKELDRVNKPGISRKQRIAKRKALLKTIRKAIIYTAMATLGYQGYINKSYIQKKLSDYGTNSTNDSDSESIISKFNSIFKQDNKNSYSTQEKGLSKEILANRYRHINEQMINAEMLISAAAPKDALNIYKLMRHELNNLKAQSEEEWRVSALNKKIDECDDKIDYIEDRLGVSSIF